MLQVLGKSTDPDYTSTSALRSALYGATATSTAQDAYLSSLIRRASRWADGYIGQPLSVQRYRETVAGFGSRNLTLARTPVRNVLAVYDATDTGTANQLYSSNGEWRLDDPEAGMITRDAGWSWSATLQFRPSQGVNTADAIPLSPAPVPGQEYKPWMVDYVAGYSYAGPTTGDANWSTEGADGTTSTERTLPEDIEQGVLLKALSYNDGGEGIDSEKLGDVETNYRSLGKDTHGQLIMPADAALDPYRRVV